MIEICRRAVKGGQGRGKSSVREICAMESLLVTPWGMFLWFGEVNVGSVRIFHESCMYFKPGDHHFGRHVHEKLDEFAFYGVHKKDRESRNLKVCGVSEVVCATNTSSGNFGEK